MTALLEATDLSLPGRLAPVSISVTAGQMVGLVGPNGSGKTSLLHALAGIGTPSGRVRIDGSDLHRSAPGARSRLLNFLPASREVHWPLIARDLILLGGAEDEEADRAIRMLELDDVADRRVDHLSTGERSRVLIARVMATEPRLLLLDEPTANLDPLWQIRLIELLEHGLESGRQAAIVAMHDLDVAEAHADRLLVMHRGEVVADGDPAEILASPLIERVFGIRRERGKWRPAAVRPADRRSSP